MRKLTSFVILGLFSSLFITNTLLAQESSSVSNRQIDEIIVTSRKTEENIQEKINLFQQMQQQAQALTQQTSQIEMSVNEIERTIKEIEDTNDKSTLYRAIGSIMQKVDNVKKLKKELMDEKETLEIRNKSLKGQVENLNVQINEMQSKLTPIVQSLQENKNQDATQ